MVRQVSGGAHGYEKDKIWPPDSWMGGGRLQETYEQTGLPYTGERQVCYSLRCTSCHNPHRVEGRPFLQRDDIETLCRACHEGRANPGDVGEANNVEPGGYSTHPTGVVVADLPGNGPGEFGEVDRRLRVAVGSFDAMKDPWVLGGHLVVPTSDDAAATPFSCQTCHAVHGSFERPGEHGPALEAIYEPGNPSALCEGCHRIRSGHPTRGVAGSPFRPATFVSAQGIPEAWGAEQHLDRGATPFDPAAGFLECTSCHDLHGGLPGTSLLYGPNTGGDGARNWCFSCHPARSLVPADHPSLAEEGIKDWEYYCGTCHDGDKARRLTWKAHRGFDW